MIRYLKCLGVNFLAVFFANHLLPGIAISYYTKLPHVGGEIIFAVALAFLLSLVFPIFRLLPISASHFKMGLATFIISFGSYAIVNLLPTGIKVISASGFLWAAVVVWVVGYITNHYQYTKYLQSLDHETNEEDHHEEEQ